jgi:hypothetical protein
MQATRQTKSKVPANLSTKFPSSQNSLTKHCDHLEAGGSGHAIVCSRVVDPSMFVSCKSTTNNFCLMFSGGGHARI